jgi:hypothetical protein
MACATKKAIGASVSADCLVIKGFRALQDAVVNLPRRILCLSAGNGLADGPQFFIFAAMNVSILRSRRVWAVLNNFSPSFRG